MPDYDELTWEEAMRRGHAALLDSEHLYDDINASEGRSNLDIEKHLPRAEVNARPGPSLARVRPRAWQGQEWPLWPPRHLNELSKQTARHGTADQPPRAAQLQPIRRPLSAGRQA